MHFNVDMNASLNKPYKRKVTNCQEVISLSQGNFHAPLHQKDSHHRSGL